MDSFVLVLASIVGLIASINIVVRHFSRITNASAQKRDADEGALGALSLQLKGLNEFLMTPGNEGKLLSLFFPVRWIVQRILFFEQYIIALDRCQSTTKSSFSFKYQSLHFLIATLEVAACLIFKLSLWFYELLRYISFAELRTIERNRNEMWNISRQLGPGTKKFKVVFIRHGESVWNEAFNRGVKISSIYSMLSCLIWEMVLIFSMDSVIFDSPLSMNGIKQACQLRDWLNFQETVQERKETGRALIELIRNSQVNGTIRFYSSNLRRAISTLVIGFSNVLRNDEKVVISSALQEVTRNPDGVSLSARDSHIISSKYEIESNATDLSQFYANNIEWGLHGGNIPLKSTLEDRFRGFLEDLNTAYNCNGCNTVIICGHSLWIQEFFKFFIDPKVQMDVKRRKIANCGIVAFDLYERILPGEATDHDSVITALSPYYIEPGTIELYKEPCL